MGARGQLLTVLALLSLDVADAPLWSTNASAAELKIGVIAGFSGEGGGVWSCVSPGS